MNNITSASALTSMALYCILAFFAPAYAAELRFPDDPAFVSKLAGEIAAVMKIFRPEISGHVLSVDDSGAFLNVGSQNGVLIGMRFAVANPESGEITIIQISRAESDYSYGPIVRGPFPDLMYGAELIQEEAWVHYIIPESVTEGGAHFFLGIADEVESAGGAKAALVGNTKWQYSAISESATTGKSFLCNLSFSDTLTGRPMVRYTVVAPDGAKLDGGFTYSGEWVPLRETVAQSETRPGWYTREGRLRHDAFAVEALDINDDGIDEIVLACDDALVISRFRDGYLEPVYIHQFAAPLLAAPSRGDLGCLGVLDNQGGRTFFLRGPNHGVTVVCELAGGKFADYTIEDTPVGNPGGMNALVLAKPADGYHLFYPDTITEVPARGTKSGGLPAVFSFYAEGDFTGDGGLERAIVDWNSSLWLETGGDWINRELLLGAGLWCYDIDSNGRDELVTTSRNVGSDRLEFFGMENMAPKFTEASPFFEGRILDVCFGELDGDGEREPIILLAFGYERKIIF
jgi:hypothetical protein